MKQQQHLLSYVWPSARPSIGESRHAKVYDDFVPGLESVNDASVKLNWWLRRNLSFSGLLQYEKWLAPILASTPQTNWTSSVEVTFWPKELEW